MNDSAQSSRVGSQVGPYQLVRLLGRGGMGEVYEAEDVRKHRKVALKLISPQFSDNAVFRERMLREADAAGRLTEPHVVPIHDYGEIDGQLYLEMRLIEGVDLATMLKKYGPMPPPRAVAIMGQIAAALDAAHAAGIQHRDVKPENILITADDFAYLVDFGIARAGGASGLTQTGTAVGTYNYMAPERFSNDEVTYRADIYSLACVLGEALSGSPPYRSDSVERLIAAHLMEPAPRPSQLRPGIVPLGLDQVIARGMAKNPRERYSSAGDLAAAAHDALTTAEQQQAAMILQQGEAGAAGSTMMAPVYQPSGPHPTTGPYPTASGPHPTSGPYPTASGPHPTSGPYPTASGPHPVQSSEFDQTTVRPAVSGEWPSQPDSATSVRPVSGEWPSQPESATSVRPVSGEWPVAATSVTPTAPPSFSQEPPPAKSKRKWLLLAAAALLLIGALGVTGYLVTRPSHKETTGQSVLPFDGLNFRLSPGGVTLDDEGNVYVTNQGMYGHVVKLAPGSSTPIVLPFSGLYEPQGVAVDTDGAVYVTDFNNRVVKLANGSNTQTELQITGLNYPEGLAVDKDGNVYVADRGNNRVVKLAAGTNAQADLPFTGLKNPDDVAVDKDGNVYVTDTDNNRVVKLEVGTNAQSELPFSGLAAPWGVAVDQHGNVFVTNHEDHKVLKLAAGSNAQTVLPFVGLNTPLQVAVDKDDDIYVADRGNNRVVKLAGD